MSASDSTFRRFLLAAWICLPLVITISGCGGCGPAATKEAKSDKETMEKEEELAERKREKPKPDFQPMSVTILPGSIPPGEGTEPYLDETDRDGLGEIDTKREGNGDGDSVANSDREIERVPAKPGHWVHVRYRLKANNNDFQGELSAHCVDSNLRPRDLERSPFWVSSQRAAVLPKGQTKNIELPLFIAVPESAKKRRVQLVANLRTRGSSRDATPPDYTPTIRLKPHQYHFVVLARNPDRYGWLRSSAVIKPPIDNWSMDGVQEDYIATLHQFDADQPVPLPGNMLAWTSIAYLLWDDLPSDALSPEQQQALVDWIHWGGQLIISGKESLSLLRGSFLDPFLPANAGSVQPVDAQALSELNATWSLLPKASELEPSRYRLSSSPESPLEVVTLEPRDSGIAISGTGDLVVERQVGRGRIVATALGLGERRVVNWQNLDGFVNGCLMRRPGRIYYRAAEGDIASRWTEFPLGGQDARLTCKLRMFSRDAAVVGEGIVRTRRSLEFDPNRDSLDDERLERQRQRELEEREAEMERLADRSRRLSNWGWEPNPTAKPDSFAMGGFRSDPVSGMSGWNDFTVAGNAARRSLQVAAGIDVPDATFIARVLSLYLLCLVPINWLVFRALRRVEWAWFAAPLIAIVGAIGVVKLAALDIGFARSRTEIAIVEMQPEYSRSHVTRYCGLYTSLTSRYEVNFEDSRAFALPFSTDPPSEQLRLQRAQEVVFVRDKQVGLSGFPVLSNSTGMVHAEQMVDFQGRIEATGSTGDSITIRNNSEFHLRAVVAIKRQQGQVRVAAVPELLPGRSNSFWWADAGAADHVLDLIDSDAATTPTPQQGDVSLRELYRLALHPTRLAQGDIVLVGWTDQEIPGMSVTPKSTQSLFRSLFVCSMRHGEPAPPQVDANHRADFPRREERDEELLEQVRTNWNNFTPVSGR